MRYLALFFMFGVLALSPSLAHAKSELWVYTSIYKEFIASIVQAFEKKHPEVDVQVFQGGSEKLQTKVEAELVVQRPQADLVMTSDPFWALRLEKRGSLHHSSAMAAGQTPFQTNYYSLMVMIAHKNFPADQRPAKWQDLALPRLNHLVHMASPLESGTAFTAVAYLSRKYGWDYFDQLRKNNIGCSGGNSAVIQKVESGEKKVGVVLLENALAARKRGSPIEIIYPSDGGIPIPSVQFILKASTHAPEAEKFAEFVLSPEGQALLRLGYMYSVNSKIAAPEGALSFEQATKEATPWTAESLQDVADHAKEIKNKFDDLVLE